MMRSLSLLVLCLACACLATPSTEYFPGRSADVIIEPTEKLAQDSVILLKGEQFSTTTLSTLDETQFADLFSHVMGTPAFHADANRKGFPLSSLFNKPRAMAIVTLDGIGSETLDKFPSLSVTKGAHAAQVGTKAFPPTTHSLLATLATGAYPSTHGIVGPSWRSQDGELVEAYSTRGASHSASIADILAQEYNGRSLIVSASASQSLARAFAVHSNLAREGWAAHAYALTSEGFSSLYEHAPSLAEFGISIDGLADVSVEVNGETVTFTAAEDKALLAELAFVRNLIAKLRDNALTKDNVPDLYSFVFYSLKNIKHRYGKDSANFAGALALADAATSDLLAALDTIYSGQVAKVVLALRPRAAKCGEDSLKEHVYQKVGRLLYTDSDFDAHYPAIYVRSSELPYYARDMMCSNLQEAVGSAATVHCLLAHIAKREVMEGSSTEDSSDAPIPNYTNPYDAQDSATVWAFWLNFWVALVIALFVGWGAYCLAYVGIDAGKDSLLYRASGRQHPH